MVDQLRPVFTDVYGVRSLIRWLNAKRAGNYTFTVGKKTADVLTDKKNDSINIKGLYAKRLNVTS